MEWTPSSAERLRKAAEGVPQVELAKAGEMSVATLQRTLKNRVPTFDELNGLATRLGRTPAYFIYGAEPHEDDVVSVSVFNVDVAAGPGRTPLDEEPVGSWPFPRDWVERRFGRDRELAVVRVSGESQEPELRDGDLVVINRRETRIADGLHVVRVDNALMIKRVAVEGHTVRLRSANRLYDDVVINLETEQDRFTVIGKAGGAVKSL